MERGLIAELSPEKYPTGGRTLTLVTLEVREGETGGGVYVNPLFKKKNCLPSSVSPFAIYVIVRVLGKPPSEKECSLHVYYRLPMALYFDCEPCWPRAYVLVQ